MSRYALVVGVGQYVDPRLPNLSRARADAQGVYDLLAAHGDFDEIHLLQDGQASYARLYERLEYVLLKQGAKADVLIYFSGHGLTAGPNRFAQQGHLATCDCVLKPSGKFLTVEKAIDFQLLNGLIAEADLARLAVFLDCCHSERFIEQALIGKGLSCFGERQYFLSTACRGYEFAYENVGEPYSAYTGALLQALDDRDAGAVTVAEVNVAVRKLLKGSGQEPISLDYGSDFVVVDYRRVVPTVSEVSEVCPYQGLRAFTPKTVEVFFGRDGDTQTLLRKLQDSNFVAVLGPSGSGKSSVVRAGLVTRLVAQGWQVVTMKPDSSPLAILKMKIREFLSANGVAAGEKRELLHTLETVGLGEMVQQLPGVDRILLLVDQFEEVFTLCEKAEQQRFVGELLAVRERADARLVVVVTMRSDFVNEWLAVGYPAAVIERDVVWLGPLRDANLRDAILKPAQKRGYAFGEGLLELLLADVAAEDNCLPLLEFALTELWEKRDTQAKKLTAAAYREMGGLKGALNERAETVYNSLREVDKPWAKRVCLRLVRLGVGEKDTRQRQLKKGLLAMGGPEASPNEQQQQTRQMIADVIQALVAGRLLVGDGDYIDLAHEALLEGWVRFAAWRQEDRDLRRLEQRMGDEYETWKRVKETAEKDEDEYLLKGGLLAEVREQREALSKRLEESRPMLMKYFADSDRKDAETVATLQRALADANVRAESLKVR
ncbi:MAG: caspase family protein, partial [Cyanobacteria bacterium J06598_3]